MNIVHYCNKVIEYAFYALFLIVPLLFSGSTSELFELNKMWFTFAITVIIVSSWGIKMVAKRELKIQRTPLDIPILLFLAATAISTVFSLDFRTSLWGYYSRFNGGFLSILCYILLYYAFVSNLTIKHVVKSLWISLISGVIVVLWGIPSHFGYDPSCALLKYDSETPFLKLFNVGCWTEAFQPTIRIFSTLGQPAWLAAYLSVLLPIIIALTLHESLTQLSTKGKNFLQQHTGIFIAFFIFMNLFYLGLLFSNTKAGFIGFWIANLFFWAVLFSKNILQRKIFFRYFLAFNGCFLLLNFLFSTPIKSLNTISLATLREVTKDSSPQPDLQKSEEAPEKNAVNITDSGDIRLIVWQGGIDAWKSAPIFGTGVETFAYAYYKFRPTAHNLTSEWDYLYNKAHNEYINYLTTTGIVGLGTYLSIIIVFLFVYGRWLYTNFLQYLLRKKLSDENAKQLDQKNILLSLALISGYISILISNFFGFSVVIINVYFFLIPVFVFLLCNLLPSSSLKVSFGKSQSAEITSGWQWVGVSCIGLFLIISLLQLMNFWFADKAYAQGNMYSTAGQYEDAYPKLKEAVTRRFAEPTFLDEYAMTAGTIAVLLESQDTTTSAELKKEVIAISNKIVKDHPNNIVFWKNRVRLFYTLGQNEPQHLMTALEAMFTAHKLAPTDVKIMYNLGVLLGQTGHTEQAVTILEEATKHKPNYKDAYFALGLFYHDLAETKSGTEKATLQKKAENAMQYILKNLDSTDKAALDSLKEWQQ